MPAFASLEVSDVAASLRWYETVLGFRPIYEGPPGGDGKPMMVHLRRSRYQDLLLFPGSVNEPGQGVVLNFLPGDEAVAALAGRARAAGGRVEGPVERLWNAREVTLYDPDGYRMRFSEPLDLGKSFSEVMDQVWGKGR